MGVNHFDSHRGLMPTQPALVKTSMVNDELNGIKVFLGSSVVQNRMRAASTSVLSDRLSPEVEANSDQPLTSQPFCMLRLNFMSGS